MPLISAPLTSSAFRPRLAPALRRRRSETSQMSSKAAPRRSTIHRRKGNHHGSTRELTVRVNALRNFDYPEAILFDCDGVLCETERDGHRVTFNMTFKENGLDHDWDVDLYGELLKIGGGKERMTHYFDTVKETSEPFKSQWPEDTEERRAWIKSMHLRKTDLFLEVVESGKLPLRPGVRRLVKEALDAGAKVAVCSTSNEKAVKGIVKTMLPEFADRIPVFAGDVVAKKKPAPDVYELAAKTLGVNPARCVVIEDTRIGLLAGKAAGMRVCVTKSIYSEDEDFTGADAVFDCIGDDGDERFGFEDLSTPGSFWQGDD